MHSPNNVDIDVDTNAKAQPPEIDPHAAPACLSSCNKTCLNRHCLSGLSCSKLTMSLVNDSLKFKSSDTQIC